MVWSTSTAYLISGSEYVIRDKFTMCDRNLRSLWENVKQFISISTLTTVSGILEWNLKNVFSSERRVTHERLALVRSIDVTGFPSYEVRVGRFWLEESMSQRSGPQRIPLESGASAKEEAGQRMREEGSRKSRQPSSSSFINCSFALSPPLDPHTHAHHALSPFFTA